ncbi:universal stress protein [Streptomyces sp. Act143]|uniref:universal stress protein n=1 Tax=Streptomyces sp. Act143 TaxID=2200760 RepID=UPI002815D74D|nr:universal stress protein [Streptomyces sp. Act143]
MPDRSGVPTRDGPQPQRTHRCPAGSPCRWTSRTPTSGTVPREPAGHGAFAGMPLGSVSHHCVHHFTCPVLVVGAGST